MPFYVYIIYSPSLNQYYIGQSKDLQDRVFRHTNSGSRFTKKANDWTLAYSEIFQTRSEAVKRENEIKKKKSRKYIDWLIQQAG